MDNSDRVYNVIRRIPRGKVATYGQIAKLTGNVHPRYIGYLLHHNPDPLTIPCHRVVSAKGELAAGYAFGGKRAQAKKLFSEGVEFVNGKIDLKRFCII